jgi:hypothetical protein
VLLQLGESGALLCAAAAADGLSLCPSVHYVAACDCCSRAQFACFLTPAWDDRVPRPHPDSQLVSALRRSALPDILDRFGDEASLSFDVFSQRSTAAYWRHKQ